jgi:hypothetical protein
MKELKTYNNIPAEIATGNLPVLFGKKSKKISIIKPLTHIDNDTGKARHYTPAAQE